MRKLIVTITALLVLMVTLTGCSGNKHEDYKEALIKTENIQSGKSDTRLELEMNFETEGLEEEVVKGLKTFEHVVYEGHNTFNLKNENLKIESRNFVSVGGLGINLDYHQDGDQIAIYVPMLGKYLNISADEVKEISTENEKFNTFTQVKLSKNTIMALEESWRNAFEAEDIVKGEKSTMETPEGDVRVVKFTVTPTEEKIKDFVVSAVQILLHDESVSELVEELSGTEELLVNGEPVTEEKIEEQVKESLEFWSVEEFVVTDFIDVDGYIVQSNTSFAIRTQGQEPGSMKYMKMEIITDNYDIEKDQTIDFPVLTETNSVSFEGLQEGLPSTYENLLE